MLGNDLCHQIELGTDMHSPWLPPGSLWLPHGRGFNEHAPSSYPCEDPHHVAAGGIRTALQKETFSHAIGECVRLPLACCKPHPCRVTR